MAKTELDKVRPQYYLEDKDVEVIIQALLFITSENFLSDVDGLETKTFDTLKRVLSQYPKKLKMDLVFLDEDKENWVHPTQEIVDFFKEKKQKIKLG